MLPVFMAPSEMRQAAAFLGDRKTYQMDYHNTREALKEAGVGYFGGCGYFNG